MSSVTYILSFNDEVLYPSHNILTLWKVLFLRCQMEKRTLPDPYHTVRRQIQKSGIYTHTPLPAWEYKIITRHMLRKTRQLHMDPVHDTDAKQSSDRSI